MANIKISELDELEEIADQDLFVIVDSDENITKKIQASNLNIKGGDTLPIGGIIEYNGTTVPDGYEKVSDGSIIEKNCISVKRVESSLSATAWQTYDVSFPTISAQKGNKLSVNENGQIVIGEGINYVKASLNFEVASSVGATDEYIQCKITKNSNLMGVGRVYNLTANIRQLVTVTPILIPVTQGDIIKMQITPSLTTTLTLGGGNYAYLTVEEF